MTDINKLRDDILQLTGVAVIQFQWLEHCLTACMAFIGEKKPEEMMARIMSPDLDRRGVTIGQLLSALRKHTELQPNLERRFSDFVENRNKLIHRLFLHNARFGAPPPKEEIEKTKQFILDVIYEAVHLQRIFLGLFLVIGKTLASREGRTLEPELSSFLDPQEQEFYSAFCHLDGVEHVVEPERIQRALHPQDSDA